MINIERKKEEITREGDAFMSGIARFRENENNQDSINCIRRKKKMKN